MELLRTNGVLMRPTRVFSIFTVSVSLLLAVSVPAHAESPLENVEGEVSSSVDDVAAYNEGILLNTTPAALMADDSTFLVTDASEVSDGNAVVRSGYANVACSGQVNHPHNSSGAGGAIYKVVITCKGSGIRSVSVRVKSSLAYSPTATGAWNIRARSDYNQWVTVNGDSVTYYVPLEGNGGHGNGYWSPSSTWQITSPGSGTVGSNAYVVQKNL